MNTSLSFLTQEKPSGSLPLSSPSAVARLFLLLIGTDSRFWNRHVAENRRWPEAWTHHHRPRVAERSV